METLKLTVLSPERQVVASLEVSEVTLPGSEGQIQMLPGHARMVGILETGVFRYTVAGTKETVAAVSTGFFEVSQDQIKILAETIELANEIDLERALKAQKIAESKLLQASDEDDHQFRKYQLKLQRALIRQQIAGQTLH